jgi:hypothetical protein
MKFYRFIKAAALLVLTCGRAFAQSPAISYPLVNTLTNGVSFTVSPVNNGGAVPPILAQVSGREKWARVLVPLFRTDKPQATKGSTNNISINPGNP